MKYEVEVQIMPSNGGFVGKTEKIPVEAKDAALAITAAILHLDSRGFTNVSVLKAVPMTS